METITEFKNDVFIAYADKDKKHLDWLLKKLKSYILPAYIDVDYTKLKKFRSKIYIDNKRYQSVSTEFGEITEAQREIEKSKWLIVICSQEPSDPDNTSADRVNEQVQKFIDLGQANRIIPVIFESTEDSNIDKSKILPPALENVNSKLIQEVSLSDKTNDISIIKLLNILLGMKLPTHEKMCLYEKINKQEKKLGILSFLAFVSFIIILGTSGFLDSDLSGSKYANKAEVRDDTLYKYDSNGNLKERVKVDSNGKPKIDPQTGAAGYRYIYNLAGKEIGYLYLGKDFKPVISKYGYAGEKYIFNQAGKRIGEYDLGLDEKPILNEYGYVGKRKILNEAGKEIGYLYLGKDLKPVIEKLFNSAGEKYIFNQAGKQVGQYYIGLDEKPILNEYGYAGKRKILNEAGKEIGYLYLGKDLKPVISKWENSAGEKYIFASDNPSNNIGSIYLGTDGKPMIVEEYGAAGMKMLFNKAGEHVGHMWLGLDGTPMVSKKLGYAGQKTRFFKDGTKKEKYYIDVAGKLMFNPQKGYALIKFGRVENGKVYESEKYYDENRNEITSLELEKYLMDLNK